MVPESPRFSLSNNWFFENSQCSFNALMSPIFIISNTHSTMRQFRMSQKDWVYLNTSHVKYRIAKVAGCSSTFSTFWSIQAKQLFWLPWPTIICSTDIWATGSKFKMHCHEEIVGPSWMHAACICVYFVRAAALSTNSKKNAAWVCKNKNNSTHKQFLTRCCPLAVLRG